jgi:hypothetical protein
LVDPGFSNVTVNLLDASQTQIATMQTNGDGAFEFTDLAPGTYYLEFVNPDAESWEFVAQHSGGDDAVDSDADTTTGRTGAITLTSGESDDTWDAGLKAGGGSTAVSLSSFAAGAGTSALNGLWFALALAVLTAGGLRAGWLKRRLAR